MNRGVTIAVIIAGAVLIAAAGSVYFSPYQSCVRAIKHQAQPGTFDAEPGMAEIKCSRR